MADRKAVILLSGGLDSAVTLYLAKKEGFECHCLIFDYGQRHKKELEAAERIARFSGSSFKAVRLDLPWKGSSLTDGTKGLPFDRTPAEIREGVPSTYVPARNTIFLSMAASFAEATGAAEIFIGAHQEDASGYPDCRRAYLEAFSEAIRLGTKAGLEGVLSLRFPLLEMTKAGIISLGASLGAPLHLTWSCYGGGIRPCGRCDSCVLRAKGFEEAGMDDPALAPAPEALGLKTPKAEITEVFSSIQGEGMFVGAKQVFVRFKECNLSCAFCDERKDAEARIYTPSELLAEVMRLDGTAGPHHSVSLTGGEPLLYADFLLVFLRLLKQAGFRTYLETNGILPKELAKVVGLVDIMAMDFKLPSSTGEAAFWDEHLEFLKTAAARKVFVKVIVTPRTSAEDVGKAVSLLKSVNSRIPFILQPATPVRKNDAAVERKRLIEFVEMATRNELENVRAIPQVHKVLSMR